MLNIRGTPRYAAWLNWQSHIPTQAHTHRITSEQPSNRQRAMILGFGECERYCPGKKDAHDALKQAKHAWPASFARDEACCVSSSSRRAGRAKENKGASFEI